MIGTATSAARNAYATMTATTSASKTNASAAQTQTGASDSATEVSLSPGGKLLSSLPTSFMDPKYHMANAEKRLNELMAEMGIPPGTDIDMHVSNSGRITVSGDSEKLAELEKMLNDGSEMDLRNSLIGAHSASIMHECAMAAQQTSRRAEANPQAAETIWTQLIAQAERIGRQSADFSFSGGKLSGSLSGGGSIEIA